MKKVILSFLLVVLFGCSKKNDFVTINNIQILPTQIKQTISANGFSNNKQIADWVKPNGPDSHVWWDMDGDGSNDKVYYSISDTSIQLNIHLYKDDVFKQTINVNDIVDNNALRQFFKTIKQNWTGGIMNTGASLNVIDFNKDSIPDLLFEVGTYEGQMFNTNGDYPTYDVMLISKGWLKYELKLFPTYAHAQMTSCGDFNNDGYPDLWKSSVTVKNTSTGLISSYSMITYFNPNYTIKEQVLTSLGDQGDQGTSYIADLDNNNIPDIIIGERDFVLRDSIQWVFNGKAPRILMNVRNGNWDKDITLIDTAMQKRFNAGVTRMNCTQSIAFMDINNDGFLDIILNKTNSNLLPNYYNVQLSLEEKQESWIQVWVNNKNNTFIDETDKWFPNNSFYYKLPVNSAGPFYTPSPTNPNPGDIITGDVDGDGKSDIYFKYYGNIYFKNMGNQFEFQRNDIGFGFKSQTYKTIN